MHKNNSYRVYSAIQENKQNTKNKQTKYKDKPAMYHMWSLTFSGWLKMADGFMYSDFETSAFKILSNK